MKPKSNAPAEAAPAIDATPEAAPAAAKLAMPRKGGSYVRQADGSLKKQKEA